MRQKRWLWSVRDRSRGQRGLAMVSIMITIFVLAVLSALVLYLAGKEIALTAVRRLGAQSLYIAEGGAASTRSALLVLMNADPIGFATLDPSLTASTLSTWYAGGNPSTQNPFALFDYIVLDGQRYNLNPNPTTGGITLHLNWGLPHPHRKLLPGVGMPPNNSLGGGVYAAAALITRRAIAHHSCAGGQPCYIHRLGPDDYEFFFAYSIASDGQMPPRARRRVTFSRDFSVRVHRQSFAGYALFTDSQIDPNSGSLVYFNRTGEFDGPVHTNGQFGFREFPKFGTPDPNSPCSQSRIQSTPLTQVSQQAWFYNHGSPRQIAQNENVVGGVRRDAPVLPDCTASQTDDGDNAAANFTRGLSAIPFPGNNYSQKGVSIGRDPTDTSAVTNMQIRQAVPELWPDDNSAIDPGIYVPVVDSNSNRISDNNESLAGGVYVQGNLDSLLVNDNSNMGYYELRQGAQTVQILVDRVNGTTTVTNSAWPSPTTRTFSGVPKGWQQPGNDSAMIIYVEGAVNALSGMLEEKEQATLAASGTITISGHLTYEDPPDVNNPNDNPLNVLGLFTSRNIMIGTTAPNDVNIHAVLMAGLTGDGFTSGVSVVNYNDAARGSRGSVHLIGGIIEEGYPPFGTLNPDGSRRSGYGRDFNYDRRMSRGFSPPYFPTTNRFELDRGSEPLAGARPIWREASP